MYSILMFFYRKIMKKFQTQNKVKKCKVSVLLNSRTLTYSGFEDFGDEIKEDCKEVDKVDSRLVLMWQSLEENFTQPIAMFAQKGPVKGDVQLFEFCSLKLTELDNFFFN